MSPFVSLLVYCLESLQVEQCQNLATGIGTWTSSTGGLTARLRVARRGCQDDVDALQSGGDEESLCIGRQGSEI